MPSQIEEVLQLGLTTSNWLPLIQLCESYELEVSIKAAFSVQNDNQFFSIYLLAYLLVNDLLVPHFHHCTIEINKPCRNKARFLWKRIPNEFKNENNELKQIWSIGSNLWKREYSEVYPLIRSFQWSAPIGLVISHLERTIRTRVIGIINKSYTNIAVNYAAQLLGVSVEDINSSIFPFATFLKLHITNLLLDLVAQAQNWIVEGAYFTIQPKATHKEQSTGLDQIQQLTEYAIYLES